MEEFHTEYAYIRCFGGALNNSIIETQVISHMMPFIDSITLRSANNQDYRYEKVADIVDSNNLPVFIKRERQDTDNEQEDHAL